MSGQIDETRQARTEADPKSTPPAAQTPFRHLRLVIDKDRHSDPIPSLAAVGPSSDF